MLSARLKAPLVTGCKAVAADDHGLTVTASFCGGKMTAEVQVNSSSAILMVLPGSFRPTGETGKAQVETRSVSVPLEPGVVRFEELILPEAGDVDITQQDVLVAVGRGIQQKDNIELAEELAQSLGGAVSLRGPWSIRAGCRLRGKSASRA